MKRKLAVLFALMALAPFVLAACGDDDDDEGTTETTTTEQTETTPGGTDGGGGAAGGGSTVAFTADPDGGLAYEQTEASAEAGAVTIELTNDASLEHDVQIEGPDGDLGGTALVSDGETAEETIELEAGEYTFYCSVPGHREGGMEGTLTVE